MDVWLTEDTPLPVAYGGVLGHGAAHGLGYGAGIYDCFLLRCFCSCQCLCTLVNTGVSTSSRQQDAFGNYAFGYGIKDGLGATNSRSEVGDGYGNKKGSYTIADIDGRARRVDYVADGHGFRATVKTNEPGTAASAPAAALIASPLRRTRRPSRQPHRPPSCSSCRRRPCSLWSWCSRSWTWSHPWFGIWSWCPQSGHGAALGLGYGAGVYGAGLGKVIL
ncbi:hypothetical protein CEXT_14101 [Caerostris extrusa]|uniref:Adult-specific rigid cuticular protein 15.7 n=1 Tax=Caerostris extrusa TaxID=172846 RepID=A0AAV4VNV0_CAEEX|nr:hypothetical protein CEXT_14101 [Caerostris extrusa]